jgi:hypothetical protein
MKELLKIFLIVIFLILANIVSNEPLSSFQNIVIGFLFDIALTLKIKGEKK